jgi:hypothetical protein
MKSAGLRRSIVILLLLFGIPASLSLAQSDQKASDKKEEVPVIAPDVSVVINERTLNGFLAAVGPVSGKDKFEAAGTKGDYTYTVRNPRIEIDPGMALFAADTSVKVGPFNYKTAAKGSVEVKYSKETNRISVKVLKANVEIYTKLFGKKIRLDNIDISKYYRVEFEFAGPQPVQESVQVTLPDGSVKTLYISIKDQAMKLEQDQIVVTSNIVFSDTPPVKDEKPPNGESK